MAKAKPETSRLLTVTRELAERYYGKLPSGFHTFQLACSNKACEVGDLVAVEWVDNKLTVGRVQRKHSQILVSIAFADEGGAEPFEWAAWFPARMYFQSSRFELASKLSTEAVGSNPAASAGDM